MSEIEASCLKKFGVWLQELPEDARLMAKLTLHGQVDESSRRRLVSALNYLFKSVDLIPDGIEDLGYMDDAFVLRVTASLVGTERAELLDLDSTGVLRRLAADAELVEGFLEADYARALRFVKGLGSIEARGRSVDAIVAEASVLEQFVDEVESWSKTFESPAFKQDEKNLIRLRAFLQTKLPS